MQLPKGRFGAFSPVKLSGTALAEKNERSGTGDGKCKSNSPVDTSKSSSKEQAS